MLQVQALNKQEKKRLAAPEKTVAAKKKVGPVLPFDDGSKKVQKKIER